MSAAVPNGFIAENIPFGYKEYCEVKNENTKKPTHTNVYESFSGLECPGDTLHNWDAYKLLYKKKFKKAKQCAQRRISTMKMFPAKTKENIEKRQSHIYPAQVAYAFAKNCSKKFATKKQRNAFENSFNKLIKSVATKQPNVQNYFGNSIENSILDYREQSRIRKLFDKQYYDNEQMNVINKYRELGYDNLSNVNKAAYESLRNQYNIRVNDNNEEVNNDEEENEEENEVDNEDEEKKEEEIKDKTNNTKNTAKKNRRRGFKTKRKSKTKSIVVKNITDINTVLQTNDFEITENERRIEITKNIEEIIKLFRDKLILDEKATLLDSIYRESFERSNKLNLNVIKSLSLVQGITSKKALKSAALNDKLLIKSDLFSAKVKLSKDIDKTITSIDERVEKIIVKIEKILYTKNDSIAIPIQMFFAKKLTKFLLQLVNSEIKELSESDRLKSYAEMRNIYNLRDKIKKINEELFKAEFELEDNLIKQDKAKEMMASNRIKAVPTLLQKTKEKLQELKEKQATLDKSVINKYSDKINKIREITQYLSTKYDNPFILQSRLKYLISMPLFLGLNNNNINNI